MSSSKIMRRTLAAVGFVLAVGIGPATLAGAQEYPPTTPTTTIPVTTTTVAETTTTTVAETTTTVAETTTTVAVEGDEVEVTVPAVEVKGDEVVGTSSLPVTGGDVLGLLVIGTAAIGAGVVLVGLRRRAEQD